MKKFIILLFITFMISSCSLTKPFIDSTHESIYIETFRDTTIYLKIENYGML